MYQRDGKKAFKKDLKNIIALLDVLDNPHKKIKTIHIAGTNGKGSVTHIIASILQESGLNVACYTSPHYIDFRERIKINGSYITEEAVIDFIHKIEDEIENIKPSFFEISVAMAFYYFAEQKVDVAVIETGLGGRLDSTNVITPLLSVITNISHDHTQFLGDTLALIAKEKAGIIKPKTPVVIGEYQDETAAVFRHYALENEATLYYANDVIKLDNYSFSLEGSTFTLSSFEGIFDTDLIGDYQSKNIQTAVAAVILLTPHFNIDKKDIRLGLKHIKSNTSFIGRNMLIHKKPLCIADSAHNEAGIDNVLQLIDVIKATNLHVVYGCVSDKDLTAILNKLPKDARYYFCQAAIPRALDAYTLQLKAKEFHLKGKHYPSVVSAYQAAIKNAKENDLILISGSVFVVAEVLEFV